MNTGSFEGGLDELALYLFDLRGFHVQQQVLSQAEVALLNRDLERVDPWNRLARLGLPIESPSQWQKTDDPFLTWVLQICQNHAQVGPIRQWGAFWEEIVRNRTIAKICGRVLGADYHIDQANLILARSPASGLPLHGGQVPYHRHQYYSVRDGQLDIGMMVVIIPLSRQTTGSGGLTLVRGSHRSSFRWPGRIEADMLAGVDWIDRLDLEPGSAVFFPEATAHAALQWVGAWERRAVVLKVYPGHLRAFGDTRRGSDEPFWAPACKEDSPHHPMRIGEHPLYPGTPRTGGNGGK